MKSVIAFVAAVILISFHAGAETEPTSLIQISSEDYGDTKYFMRIVEIERNDKTSKLRLTYKKLGSSVGSSMFIVRGFYEVAKARGAEYFFNLKEWDDNQGGRIYVAGFTNTKDADIKKEFGDEFDYEDKFGQKRIPASVTQFKIIFDRLQKIIEQKAPVNGATPHR